MKIPIKTKKHDQVYHLHFAAQPKLHNPIEIYERKDKFCFAGAYYHRYKERIRVFDRFSKLFLEGKGLDIYDRNYPDPLPEHAFPKAYHSCILGTLPSSQIDVAYKGYVYGVNMNSIQQSQTMFARRVFEMLASNTVTVGNFAKGLKNYFGDLTICTDDAKTLELYLEKYCGSSVLRKKYCLQGLRKVLREHLYEDRLGYITEKVYGKNLKTEEKNITVIAKVENDEQARYIEQTFSSQVYGAKKLIFVGDLSSKFQEKYTCYTTKESQELFISQVVDTDYVAIFSVHDWYGENYLLDMMLTLRYTQADVVGKGAAYRYENGEFVLGQDARRYQFVDQVWLRRGMASKELLSQKLLSQCLETTQIKGEKTFSIDEFNYCENYTEDVCAIASDMVIADKGLSLEEIEHAAEGVKVLELAENALRFTGKKLFEMINYFKKEVKFAAEGQSMNIISSLSGEKHVYVYLPFSKFEVKSWMKEDKLPVQFRGSGSLDVMCAVICYDKRGEKLQPLFVNLNRKQQLVLPKGTHEIEFSFRIKGAGTANIREIVVGDDRESNDKTCFLTRSNVLMLTNHYPSQEALYRNMFVHKRITAYKDAGRVYDVMRMNPYAGEGYREFEGVNVIETKGSELIHILQNGSVDTVCVHFLDQEMWGILREYLSKIKLVIWSHGADISPWWRRKYLYHTDKQLQDAKKESEARMNLWRDVFQASKNYDIHFVYVSQHFADEIMEDYQIQLPNTKYTVIHNFIDTEQFQYVPKDIEQRKKILSIKSFASITYANDLTAKGIVELSKRKCFKDMEIDIYGSGEYFKEHTASLKKYKNVRVHEQFLTQREIAALHQEHGVFIATTRGDTQGVSRDEAMSSGLVPIASNCAAIPEFVDDDCGILIPKESYVELAAAIERLYYDPELFQRLSQGAGRRVRNQSAKKFTIDKEIELIENV